VSIGLLQKSEHQCEYPLIKNLCGLVVCISVSCVFLLNGNLTLCNERNRDREYADARRETYHVIIFSWLLL